MNHGPKIKQQKSHAIFLFEVTKEIGQFFNRKNYEEVENCKIFSFRNWIFKFCKVVAYKIKMNKQGYIFFSTNRLFLKIRQPPNISPIVIFRTFCKIRRRPKISPSAYFGPTNKVRQRLIFVFQKFMSLKVRKPSAPKE